VRLGWLAALGFFVGCAPGAEPGGVLGDALERQDSTSSLCQFGGWADAEDSRHVVHVREDGSDTDGNGTRRNPYATVDAALEHLRDDGHNGKSRIAVGPGVFDTSVHLAASDPKVEIVGCSAARTTLQAVSPGESVISVDGQKHAWLRGVTVAGGRRALRVRDGGRFDVRGSVIDGSSQVGVLVQGEQSRLHLHDTTVTSTQALDDRGWGVAVIDGGRLEMNRGGVYDSVGVGIFGDDADVTLSDVEVIGTQTTGRFDSELGRGLHLQNGSSLEINGGLFRDNSDAALFLRDPKSMRINGIVIDITSAGIVIDFPSTGLSGDGIVVHGGQPVTLTDNLITGSARAAILFDGATGTVSGNETDDNGLVIDGTSIFAQEQAHVGGDDAGLVYDLQGPLLLNTWTIDADALR